MTKDEALAKEVIDVDEPMANEFDHSIERETINFIALYQPEARTLRSVYMYAKIGTDLERLADHGVNIAESAQYLIARPDIKPYIDIPRMSDEARKMLADAMTAFSTQNTRLAIDVVERDDIVDQLGNQILRELLTYMMADPSTIDRVAPDPVCQRQPRARRRPGDQYRRGRRLCHHRAPHPTQPPQQGGTRQAALMDLVVVRRNMFCRMGDSSRECYSSCHRAILRHTEIEVCP